MRLTNRCKKWRDCIAVAIGRRRPAVPELCVLLHRATLVAALNTCSEHVAVSSLTRAHVFPVPLTIITLRVRCRMVTLRILFYGHGGLEVAYNLTVNFSVMFEAKPHDIQWLSIIFMVRFGFLAATDFTWFLNQATVSDCVTDCIVGAMLSKESPPMIFLIPEFLGLSFWGLVSEALIF